MKVVHLLRMKHAMIYCCYHGKAHIDRLEQITDEDYLYLKNMFTYYTTLKNNGYSEYCVVNGQFSPHAKIEYAQLIVDNIKLNAPTIPLDDFIIMSTDVPNDINFHTIRNETELSYWIENVFKARNPYVKSKIKKKHKTSKLQKQIDHATLKHEALVKATVDKKRMISIDVEAFERNQSRILEIGFSIVEGDYTKHRHFIIKENAEYRNSKFVDDNRDNFAFGASEVISLESAMQIVKQEVDNCEFLVGHAILNDIDFLKGHGLSSDHCTLFDTAWLSKCLIKSKKTTLGLKDLLQIFEIQYEYLHNAGNDSVYTMLALQRMADLKPLSAK